MDGDRGGVTKSEAEDGNVELLLLLLPRVGILGCDSEEAAAVWGSREAEE